MFIPNEVCRKMHRKVWQSVCNFEVSSEPVAQIAFTQKLGETQESRLALLERFR